MWTVQIKKQHVMNSKHITSNNLFLTKKKYDFFQNPPPPGENEILRICVFGR